MTVTYSTVDAYTNWRQVDESLSLQSTHLIELLRLWESKIRNQRLPKRDDFEAVELMKFGGRIVLIDVERQPLRFGYRLIGSHVTNALGRDSTGEYLDQIYDPEFYERAIGTFKTNIDKRIPLRAYGNMVHAFKPYLRFETIDIPLADDGETVNMILKGSEFSR